MKNHLFIERSNANKLKIKTARRKFGLSLAIIAIFSFMFFLPFQGTSAMTKVKGAAAYSSLALIAITRIAGETDEAFEIRKKQAEIEDAFITKAKNEILELKQIKEIPTTFAEYTRRIKELDDKYAALETKSLGNLTPEQITTLKDELSTAILDIKALKETPKNKETKGLSFKQVALNALKENKDKILTSMKDGKPFDLELKYAETITEDNTILAGDTFQSLTQNTGIMSSIRRRITRYLQNVSTGSISTRFALWFEEVTTDGKPYFIHEKDTKAKSGFKVVEKTEPVKKVAVRAKMSMEWMEDLPQFVAFMQNKLMKQMDIETEDKLFNGVGGTGSDEPLGITINAVAYTGGSLANSVFMPNVADVIRGLALQVEEAFGIANAIFVHPGMLAKLDTIKTNQGFYVRPSWATNNDVAGLRIIPTMALGADEFVGGDLTVMNVLFREGLTVRIGETGDDFQENKKSILMEQRLVQFISANDYAQIVKGTFTNAEQSIKIPTT